MKQRIYKVNVTYGRMDSTLGRLCYVVAASGPAGAMLNTLEAPQLSEYADRVIGINLEEISGNIIGNLTAE